MGVFKRDYFYLSTGKGVFVFGYAWHDRLGASQAHEFWSWIIVIIG